MERKRSNKQNNHYWGVVVPAFHKIFRSAHCNYTEEQAHEVLKTKFLYDCDPFPRIKSTTELSTQEFIDYIIQIQEWAASDFEVYIPDANESLKNI